MAQLLCHVNRQAAVNATIKADLEDWGKMPLPRRSGRHFQRSIQRNFMNAISASSLQPPVEAVLRLREDHTTVLCNNISSSPTVNPGNAPLVVLQLCDDECPEDFIKVLLYLSVLSYQMILLLSNVRRG
ncbi:hypothetical protein H6P81_002359 [Aristolochia fimbriata]|uniref:Uncharacterized protein n=1 Tax=Aristolochia fimbriata TaxID=158543 RepID=A0AAV7FAQ2_ARIFI|nr:hypothetical protein H6P81_002359 [Aristolochia fimbriata]